MGAKLQVIEAVEIEEVPGLREACEGEAAAVKLIHELKLRLQTAKASIVLRQRDRDALASRLARGEDVTGADLRQATEAVSDAEGTVKLLEEALPKTISAAKSASLTQHRAEAALHEQAKRPYRDALEKAETVLRQAQSAVDAAKANVDCLPPDAQEKLEAILDHHGRDRSASPYMGRLWEVERSNAMTEQINSSLNPGQQRPLQPYPP